MNPVFAPAASLMDRLRYTSKFILLFAIVLIPLGTLSTVVVNQYYGEVQYLEHEHQGLSYIKALRGPMEHIQQHRGMTSAYKNGAEQFLSRILTKRQEIDIDFAELVKIDNQLLTNLQTQDRVNQLSAQWQAIKANSLQQPLEEAIKAHNILIADILRLITHIANTSGIILDPKLDSYHLGNAITNNLPQLIEYMGQTRATASGIAAHGSLNPQSLTKLLTLLSNVDAKNRDLDDDWNVAFTDNPDIGKKLTGSTDSAKSTLRTMQDTLQRKLLNSEPIAIDSESVFAVSTQAISAAYQLYTNALTELDDLFSARSRLANQRLQLTVTGLIATLLIVIYLLCGLSYSIQHNINAIDSATKRLAANDISTRIRISTRDEMSEIADNFNTMAEAFSTLISRIIETGIDLHASSKEMYQVAQRSAGNIERQRMETTSVATAVTEMSATIQEVATTTSRAATAANQANAQARQSKTVVESASTSISQLAREIENAANVIQLLETDSKAIGSVLDVIKSIAEQTNLLALNAAIEAARAGEHGRGFAVVADEVRTLASRTQESTAVIQSMIAKLQSGSRNAVNVMQQSRIQAQASVDQAKDVAQMLEVINQSVATIDAMNIQIASAAEQQTAVTEEISRNIVHISDLSQQTSAGSAQTTASAGHLNQLADDLQKLINQFKTG